MPDQRRIFIALPLAPEAADSLSRWIGKFSRKSQLQLRLVALEGLHLTLIPPWYAGDEEIKEIEKTLEDAAANVKPFAISLTQVSYGPDPRSPRLIWATGPHSAEAEKFRSGLYQKLRESGLGAREAEKRNLLTHVTLARFNPEAAIGLIKEPIEDKGFEVRSAISGVSLMESLLSPAGVRYETIRFAKFPEN